MHQETNDDFPDLALLAGEFWDSDPAYSPLDDHSTHEIESLKLYAYIVWPKVDMHDKRRTFLAHCFLCLSEKYRIAADVVRHERDGIRRPAMTKNWTEKIYAHMTNLSRTHLLNPSAGSYAALERGRLEISKDIERQLKKTRIAVAVADFILRCLVHISNGTQISSINTAAFFIESEGFSLPADRFMSGGHKSPNRSEIIQAWSQSRPSIIFSLAAFYSESIFLSNILETLDPSGVLAEVWLDDTKREQFFGIARYCEKELSSFKPMGGKTKLLDPLPGLSVSNMPDLNEVCPWLQGFSDQERESLLEYRAKLHT